jgi:hypothetical protein
VTEVLASLDALLLVIVWGTAGAWAAALPYGASAAAIRRDVVTTVVLIAVGLSLAAADVMLGQAGWLSLQASLPAVAILFLSVPRLLRLGRAAGVFPRVVAPSLRQEAAHPLVAWPVQATALGAVAGAIVRLLVASPATAVSSFAVATGTGLAALACWILLHRRHSRLAVDVVFPSRQSRLSRTTSVVVTVAALIVAGPLAAVATATPPPGEHPDSGHPAVELGGDDAAQS